MVSSVALYYDGTIIFTISNVINAKNKLKQFNRYMLFQVPKLCPNIRQCTKTTFWKLYLLISEDVLYNISEKCFTNAQFSCYMFFCNKGAHELTKEFWSHLITESECFHKTIGRRHRHLKAFHQKGMSTTEMCTYLKGMEKRLLFLFLCR